MASDVSHATLQTVFRISIGKLRVLHSTSQPNVLTPVPRVSNSKDSTAQPNATNSSRPVQTSSTGNRLLRSLLITRIARKARSQLILQQTQMHVPMECTTATDVSPPTSYSKQSESEKKINPGSPEVSEVSVENTPPQLTPSRKRSASDSNQGEQLTAKQPCQRSWTIHSAQPETDCTTASESANTTENDTENRESHSANAPVRNYWNSDDETTHDMSSINRVQDPGTVPRYAVNPRGTTVVMTTSNSDQSDVCHMQSTNTVPHLTTISYRLLSGVS